MGKVAQSPERAALAAAIKVRDGALDEKTAATAALQTFDDLLDETRAAWGMAGDAVDKAKQHLQSELRMNGGSEAAMVQSAAIQGLPAPRTALAAAQSAFDEADERFKLGKEGREAPLMRVQAADHGFAWADKKVREAAYEVEREPLATLLEEAKAAHAKAYALRSVVRHLASNLDGVASNYNVIVEGLAPEVRRFLSSGIGDNSAEAVAPWQAFREALMSDPDAPLPFGGS